MDGINVKALKYTCLTIIGLIIFFVSGYYFPIIFILFVIIVGIFIVGFGIYAIYVVFDEIFYEG